MLSKYHKLESNWVIRYACHNDGTLWTLLHDHSNTPDGGTYGYVHSYMQLGSYKCNKCGERAPIQVNGFFELCRWEA